MEKENYGGYGLEGYPSEGSNQDVNLTAASGRPRNAEDQYAATNSDFAERKSDALDAEIISSDDLDEEDFEEGYSEEDEESAEDTSRDDFKTTAI